MNEYKDLLSQLYEVKKITTLENYFFTDGNYTKTPLPLHTLGTTKIINTIDLFIKRQPNVLKTAATLQEKAKEFSMLGDHKKHKSVTSKHDAIRVEQHNFLTSITDEILAFYNNVHTTFKIIRFIKSKNTNTSITIADLVDTTDSLLNVIDDANILSYQEKKELRNLNSLRNFLAHNKVYVALTPKNMVLLNDNLKVVNNIMKKIVNDYSTPIELVRETIKESSANIQMWVQDDTDTIKLEGNNH